ncbi:S9 family peptidase [Halapricum hydrolyticum]|uniref:Prolyl oligopeptidase family serine peptidase n=1 Tax=Halapricum hydrolyticum TaxID=2979991 RepID=A0AAE3ICP3_9EURY|nr:prolyl oligopeptidase family serine peptidase [Halapricum hydrolyticum]MCU4717227.1 prolyl oligopeptidase family serine peptidase [Halapricum hydrolyticum]MCU4726154.1 prolyl oligopeptidase family serine peptidase [Halapricum hydrolyticum]
MSSDPTVPLEDVAGLPEFYHPTISPDGSRVALYYDETGRNELYVLDRASGERRQISNENVPRDARWWIRWGASGDEILFHRDEAGNEQNDLYTISLDGDVEEVLAVDGQGLLFDVADDAILFGSDEGKQLNLYRHDRESDRTIQLTDYDQPIRGAQFSPSGDRIAYVTNESRQLENTDVYVATADGSDPRTIAVGTEGSETQLHDWLPGGNRLLVSDDTEDRRRVGVYDLATESVTWLGPHEAEESGVAVGLNGQRALTTRTRGAAVVPVVYDLETLDGRELDLPEGAVSFHVAGGSVFADASTVVFGHSTPAERKRLLAYDLDADDYRVLLDAEYGSVDPDVFVDAEYVTYESPGATPESEMYTIGALLYDPRDGTARGDDKADIPAVVFPHGGPHAQTQRQFDVYTQFLVSQGYAVLRPNYRGSTGRGREFKRAIHGDWGGDEQADIAEGGRWLMNRQWIDADRVAVFGGSYGGYSVYCQLTQYPALWTTGIAWIGITDLHRLYEEDMPHFQHQLRMQMGDPEENYELWRERSPIEHVDAIERPICIIHGANDPRCPIGQARRFRDALEERGWEDGTDFEYHELGEEGHGSTDIQQKIRAFEILGDYLDRRL